MRALFFLTGLLFSFSLLATAGCGGSSGPGEAIADQDELAAYVEEFGSEPAEEEEDLDDFADE